MEKLSHATISYINTLPYPEKREIYTRVIPAELLDRFQLSPYLHDAQGNDLLTLRCEPGSSDTEMALRHKYGFPDPVLYGHITDTLNGQLHILLYNINDPDSPRFDIDILPDGRSTNLGAVRRNLPAEQAAMQAGLAPGQIRRGLRMLGNASDTFENFVASLGHELYFAEPLYYHNAILFEKNGFAYAKGRKLMEEIEAGFSADGALNSLLDSSTPFRFPEASISIRKRSWAIHDGILGEPFTGVTMYKRVGKHAGIQTSAGCNW